MTLYVPSHFRVEDRALLLQFMRANAFATLVSSGTSGLNVSHVPLIADQAADGSVRLLGHVARANPQWSALEEADHVVAIFHGPHAYVYPSWYEHHPAVPTWNYAVVHAHGKPRLMDETALRELLRRLSSTYEEGRPSPWRMDSLAPDYVAKMVGVIGGFTIEVERIDGKFKLSQNRPGQDAARVKAELEAEGETQLAALMAAHGAGRKG
jgi:transcriptional regulator